MFKFLKRLRGEKAEATSSQLHELEPRLASVEEIPTAMETNHSHSEGLEAEPKIIEAPEANASITSPMAEALETESSQTDTDNQVIECEPVVADTPKPVEVEEVELPSRNLGKGIRSLFSADVDLEDLEDILLLADFGVDASVEITQELKRLANKRGASSDAELRLLLKDLLTEKLSRRDSALNLSSGDLPYVILVVGVNGAGKTTTIGKLSRWLKDGDWNVVLGAADTFRAAAVDQLATWAARAEAKIVRPERDGQDPAAVAYQTVELALREQADIAIIDTAGRLQNKKDLMDELAKIRRAVEKHARISEVLLVIDATTGQNAIAQARAFTEVADVTGIVMTKLDGTAKGGILYSLQQQLDLPVKLVGVGESVNDFAFFSPEEFAKGLVAYKS